MLGETQDDSNVRQYQVPGKWELGTHMNLMSPIRKTSTNNISERSFMKITLLYILI